MDQGPIGMEKHFRMSCTLHCLLTTHHGRRNSSPQSRPNALEAVLTPAIWMDFPAPRQRAGDPHRNQILILGRSSARKTTIHRHQPTSVGPPALNSSNLGKPTTMSWNNQWTQLSSLVHDEIPLEYPSGNITVRLMPVISSMAPTEIVAVGGVKYAEPSESGLRGSYSNPEVSCKGKDQIVSNTFCVLSLPLWVQQPPSPSPCNNTPSV